MIANELGLPAAVVGIEARWRRDRVQHLLLAASSQR
jgi:hypothetical protein